jgi:hypothetical protein
VLLVLLVGAALADAGTTALALSMWGASVEANPFYHFMFLHLGYAGLLLPKLTTFGLYGFRHLKFGQLAIGFAIGMQTLAAALNLGQILWMQAALS